MIDQSEIVKVMMTVFLGLVRLGIIFFVVPFMGGDHMTGVTRNVVIVSMSIVVWYVMYVDLQSGNIDMGQYVSLVSKEAFLGIVIGFMVSIPFWVTEATGNLIDFQRGASSAQMYDPFSRHQSLPFGVFLRYAIVTLMFVSGAFNELMMIIYESYVFWPVFTFYPDLSGSFLEFFYSTTERILYMILMLASPFVLIFFLTDFGLGLINRFAPNLDVYFISMPIKSILGVFFVFIYVIFLNEQLKDLLEEYGSLVRKLFGIL